jgi:hypothetical protein
MNNFNLHNEPIDYQLSIHVSNLILTWSSSEVLASCYMLKAGQTSRNYWLDFRLKTLVECYGWESLESACLLLDVNLNIDFSQDEAVV